MEHLPTPSESSSKQTESELITMAGYALNNDAGSNSVRRIGELNITGNVIPMTWFEHLRYPNGKPHVNAIIILADIVFWYRPMETRDEQTGMRMDDRKRFEATYLQRTRSSYAKQYGLTNKQAKDAFDFLESKEAIRIIVAKSMTTKEGKRLGNVPYIDLNAEKIAEFNQPLVPTGPRLGTYKSEPLVPTGPTYTETTVTEIVNTETTETTFHVEKSNNDFPRAATVETPQQSLFDNLPETTTDGYTVKSKQPVLSKERSPKKPDALFDAIAEVWQSAPGMTGKIKQQLTGKIPEKKPDYVTNFDRPATPEEVRAFAGWYAKACRGCPMPLARDKIQHHFYAFRRAQIAHARKATPKTREANGRLLEYNSDSMKWYDIGPAPLNYQLQEAYVS